MDKGQLYALLAGDYARKPRFPTPATAPSPPRLMTQTDDRIGSCIGLG